MGARARMECKRKKEKSDGQGSRKKRAENDFNLERRGWQPAQKAEKGAKKNKERK
jgi:hypothetical protein